MAEQLGWFYQTAGIFFATMKMYLAEYSLFTSYQARLIQTVVVIGVTLVTIKAWTSPHLFSINKTISIAFLGPVSLTLLIHAQDASRGTPDDNCHLYARGHLVYIFLGYAEVPELSSNFGNAFGDSQIILNVLAPERWGSEPHQCRLSRLDPKVKDLIAKLKAQQEEEEGAEGDWGDLTFSFGGSLEKPNVQFRPTVPPDRKDVPPEVPVPKEA